MEVFYFISGLLGVLFSMFKVNIRYFEIFLYFVFVFWVNGGFICLELLSEYFFIGFVLILEEGKRIKNVIFFYVI